MTHEEMQQLELQTGEYVADAQLGEKIGEGGGVQVWSAIRDDGDHATVYSLDPVVAATALDAFLGAAADAARPDQVGPEGTLQVVAVDPVAGAYVGALSAAGTLADLPALGWKPEQRVALFKKIVSVVAALHDRGVVHGWLRPENVLLDNELNPIVANARGMDIGTLCRTDPKMVWIHRVYAAPEVRHGSMADPPADVYALGRILHFIMIGKEPDEKDEVMPRLDGLVREAPSAVARIVRKCTVIDTGARYANAIELAEDLERAARHVPAGMPHPDIDGRDSFDETKRPSQRPSGRPSAGGAPRPAGLRPAIEISRKRVGIPFWSKGIAVGFGLLGVLQVLVPMAITYFTGLQHLALDLVAWTAALPFGVATPGFSARKWLGRVLTAAASALALVMLDPVTLAAEARLAGLKSSDPAARLERFKAMQGSGETEFRGMNLEGADLSGMDLSKLKMEGSNLEGANCSGTNFSHALLENVNIAGANLTGANLSGVHAALMKDFEHAKCDERTVMPEGYTCRDGAPMATFR